MLHGLSCLLVYENAPASTAARCHDLLRCAFLRKLSGCVRNITAFCQHLLRPIKSIVLADSDILARLIYRSITLQLHNFSVNCTRDLFKPSKDVTSLQVCNEKKLLGFVFL